MQYLQAAGFFIPENVVAIIIFDYENDPVIKEDSPGTKWKCQRALYYRDLWEVAGSDDQSNKYQVTPPAQASLSWGPADLYFPGKCENVLRMIKLS